MEKIVIEIEFNKYTNINELEETKYLLSKKAIQIIDNAYAPYSGFSVGAAVLLENGKIITGTNQENAAYPSGLCAERTALFYANSKFPDVAVKAIAVAAKQKGRLIDTPVVPCGACRQVMLETENRFNSKIEVILISNKSVLSIKDSKSLLPLSFTNYFVK